MIVKPHFHDIKTRQSYHPSSLNLAVLIFMLTSQAPRELLLFLDGLLIRRDYEMVEGAQFVLECPPQR